MRRNADPSVAAGKHARLSEPHVAPIAELCARIEADGHADDQVPAADPDWGGVGARVLVLLRDPGTKTEAEHGSGLVSPDNDDPTAERLLELIIEHGLAAKDVLLWNVVPWLRPGNAGQGLRAAERDRGNAYLGELLTLLKDLKVVLVLGRAAQESLERDTAPSLASVMRIDAPHPGRLAQNQPGMPQALDAAFARTSVGLNGHLAPGSVISTWPDEPEVTAREVANIPPEAAERLGPFYVYMLVDPRTEEGFYIGKGAGQRLLAHGREADLTTDATPSSEKVRRIRELRSVGLEPRVDIVRHGLDEYTAFEVEAALIDCFPELTNLASGHGAARGRVPLEEYVTRYGASPVAANAPPVVLIRIGPWKELVEELEPGVYRSGNGYWPGMPIEQLIDSTRAWWRISPKTVEQEGIEYAVAVHAGVTRAVLRIGSWTQREDGRRAFAADLVDQGPVFDAWVGEVGRRVEFVTAARNPIIYWRLRTS